MKKESPIDFFQSINDEQQYEKGEPLRLVALIVLVACACLCGTGCVSGNKAEISAVKIEKQSTAAEVDQYVTTAGRVANWLFPKKGK